MGSPLQPNEEASPTQRGSLSYSTRRHLLSTGAPLLLFPPGRERGWRQWEEVRSLVRRLMPPPRIPSKAGNASRPGNHSKVSSANRTIHWYQRCQPPPKSPGPSKPTLSPPGRERGCFTFLPLNTLLLHQRPSPRRGELERGCFTFLPFYLFTFKHSYQLPAPQHGRGEQHNPSPLRERQWHRAEHLSSEGHDDPLSGKHKGEH